MLRSTAIAALAAILPALANAQSATHTIVRGNTLSGLAEQYLGDARAWPRILEANRDRVSDPDRLTPGVELRIPGELARVDVQVAGSGPAAEAAPANPGAVVTVASAAPSSQGGSPSAQQTPERTVFYRERVLEVADVSNAAPVWDVPPDQFYSAPWLIPLGTVPESLGAVESFSGGEEPSGRTVARVFDRLRVRVAGTPPEVGTRLQLLRVTREVRDVGQVVQPTGVLVVEEVTPAGVVGTVESQFERIALGDLVRALPPYTPLPAGSTVAATGGAEAMVLAFATDRAVQTFGDFAFFDAGANAGVRIGDEYVVLGEASQEWGPRVHGRLKVVAVLQDVSTARIVELENPVFPAGVRLRPDRRSR